MKQTMPLATFAAEIERQKNAKRDYIAPANFLKVDQTGALIVPIKGSEVPFTMRDTFNSQLAREIKFPAAFYNESRVSYPEQWANLVNAMLADDPRHRMVRTLDGDARAYLSNSYARIDNWQIAEMVLRLAQQYNKDWQVVGSHVTDNGMYIKALTHWQTDIVPGKPVRMGWIIENDEIGRASASVRTLMEMRWCTNGAIKELANRVRHAGRPYLPAVINGSFEMSNETRAISDSLLMSQMRDMIHATISEKNFTEMVDNFRNSRQDTIPTATNVSKVVEVTAKEFGIRDTEQTSILRYLSEGGELNRFGMIDAVTLAAQHVESYDYSIYLEEVGGKMINMPTKQWDKIITLASQN